MAEPSAALEVQSQRLRFTSLTIGAIAVLLALLSSNIAGFIEHVPVHGLVLDDEKLGNTAIFSTLFWVYTLLGVIATSLAIAAYLRGGFGRAGRVGLVLGVVALAWKYVLYAFIILVIGFFLASGIGA